MNWKPWAMVLGLCALGTGPQLANATDRKDGSPTSQVIADPSVDIADVFAWMSSSSSLTYMAMTVNPDATTASKFSSTAYYVFHTNAKATYKDAATQAEVNVICSFDQDQKIECWVVGTDKTKLVYLKGDANQPAGISSRNGELRVFAGLRNDPFFFNEAGLKTVITNNAAKIDMGVNAAGCPATISAADRTTANNALKTPANTDAFAGKNVLALVVQVNTNLLTSTTRPIVSVWASTNKK